LRRLVFAAAACDGAAGAAANAADEIAQLRLDVQRAAAREEQRSRLASYNKRHAWSDGGSVKDREREKASDAEARSLAAQKRTDEIMQRYNYNKREKSRDTSQQALLGDAVSKEVDRHDPSEAAELAQALAQARSELASSRHKLTAEADELVAARHKLEAEAEARARTSAEVESLGKRLRRSEAQTSAANDDTEVLRTGEAVKLQRLHEELSTARSRSTAEAA